MVTNPLAMLRCICGLPIHRHEQLTVCTILLSCSASSNSDVVALSEELERSKASVARLLKERDDLDDKNKQILKELKQAINEKSVQVRSCFETMAPLYFGVSHLASAITAQQVSAMPSLQGISWLELVPDVNTAVSNISGLCAYFSCPTMPLGDAVLCSGWLALSQDLVSPGAWTVEPYPL